VSASAPRPTDGLLGSEHWIVEACRRAGLVAADAVLDAAKNGTPLPRSAWDALIAFGATEEAVLAAVCAASATHPADLEAVGPQLATVLPQSVAVRYHAVPLRVERGRVHIATSNPLSETLERDAGFATGRRVEMWSASPRAIARAIDAIYSTDASRSGTASVTRSTPTPLSNAAIGRPTPHSATVVPATPTEPAANDATRNGAAEGVDRVLAEAFRLRASDLHFEPTPDGTVLVRMRVDGALSDLTRFSAEQAPSIIRRLKIMAQMDIADSLRPQDGRASATFEGRPLDLRVSTLPLGGNLEKVVLRVLDGGMNLSIDQLGFTATEYARVERVVGMPEGLILVVGPTGSGKTTTLYSVLRHIARREHNVITVEDPVEYRVEGITQVQVNEKARMTFASALRSILRQDPDVVFVGEIRDAETAEIAIKASMTGHLVLSTLHTADAASTVDRLLGMNVEPTALATALKGIVAQRLVRRLCIDCAKPISLSELPAQQQSLLMGRPTKGMRRPVGCPKCRGTGYRGRLLVSEVVVVVPAIQRAIARHADVTELAQISRECGMQSMWDSGLERVLDGTTSLGELLDNVPAPLDDVVGNAQEDVDALLKKLLGDPKMQAPPAPPKPPLPQIDAPVTSKETPIGSSRLAAPRPAPSGDRTRILLVDDDAAQRREIAIALEQEGFGVIEAADGEAAVAYARHLRPQLVLCEMALPKLDGAGVLQAIRGAGAPPVIVFTRQTDAALLHWARELGAVDAISRPVEIRTLATTLRAILKKSVEKVA
jgi:type IV pilus assembly protein PilB